VFRVTQNVPTATIVPTIPKTMDIVSPVETMYGIIRNALPAFQVIYPFFHDKCSEEFGFEV
jgi:hypothetical protein